jgi:membrane-associated phospholipid phosphatase
MAILFVAFYPHLLAVVFLLVYLLTDVPAKGLFLLRALTALGVAVFLAHVNRIFGIWPAYLLFPSGHTTFCAGVSWSLAMLRPWTAAVTFPLVVVMAVDLVLLHDHTPLDVLGAFPLVVVVYSLIHAWWRLRPSAPSLDSVAVSS